MLQYQNPKFFKSRAVLHEHEGRAQGPGRHGLLLSGICTPPLPSPLLSPRAQDPLRRLVSVCSPAAVSLSPAAAATGRRPARAAMGRPEHRGAGDPVVVVEPTVPLLRERDKS